MNQLRSELLKLRTTRTIAGLLLVQVAIILLAVLAQGLSVDAAELRKLDSQRTLFSSASTATLFAAFVGMLTVTNEFRFGTIRPTLVVEPRRRVVLGAKLVVSALAGVVFGVVGAGVAFGAGLPVLSGRQVDLTLDGGTVALIAGGTVAASALWALLGVAVGALLRHQIGAIVALVAWSSIVESVLFAFVPSVGRYLPGQAANSLTGAAADKLVSPGAGAAVLVAWAIALAIAAAIRTDRSDIA